MNSSNILSIALKRFKAIGPAIASAIIIIGRDTAKTLETSALFLMQIVSATTSIIGARNRPLISIKKVFCTVVTSVVVRVISEAVEKRSMFENEKVCTFLISAFLISAPKPMPAKEAVIAAEAPQKSEQTARPSIFKPSIIIVLTASSLLPETEIPFIVSTMSAITCGISSSKITSPIISTGEIRAKNLYFFAYFNSLNILTLLFGGYCFLYKLFKALFVGHIVRKVFVNSFNITVKLVKLLLGKAREKLAVNSFKAFLKLV